MLFLLHLPIYRSKCSYQIYGFPRGQPKGRRMNPAVLERCNDTPFAREARFQFFEYVTSHEVMAATGSVCINMASLFLQVSYHLVYINRFYLRDFL